MFCINCKSETNNKKFCSRSCSTSFNNRTTKLKVKNKCISCDNLVSNNRLKYCGKCNINYQEFTIGEYRNKASVKDKHPSWLHSHIRGFARSWLKHLAKLPCKRCKYDKHVELAHIKGLSEFSDDTKLKDINSENNVIQLCPNCHWEFDNLDRKDFWNNYKE